MKPSEMLHLAMEYWETDKTHGAIQAIYSVAKDDLSYETVHARISAADWLKEAALQEKSILRLVFNRAISLAEAQEAIDLEKDGRTREENVS